jgi:hypothetical protein
MVSLFAIFVPIDFVFFIGQYRRNYVVKRASDGCLTVDLRITCPKMGDLRSS